MKLLSDAQVQRFLRDGYLTLQANLSADFHAQVRTQIDDLFRNEGNPGNDILPKVPDLYRVLRDERISGALASVLGPDYIRASPSALSPKPSWQQWARHAPRQL